ncbi:MAG: M28 family peptidase [Rikenellaceae bacterium]
MKKFTLLACAALGVLTASAQYSTKFISKLIDDTDYKYIVGEASGERILNNAMDLSGYERYDRDFENLWEAEQLYKLLGEYGLAEARICRYPRTAGMFSSNPKVWAAVEGNIWTVEPSISKLADIGDIPPALVANSHDADITTELVWVGTATEKELAGLDLKGKIAVGNVSVRSLHPDCVKLGAAGVISIFNARPFIDATQLSNSSISYELAQETKSFAFQISPREGESLINRLRGGEKITVKAVVKTKEVAMDYQSPTCCIKGSDPDAGEITFSAHLFEGYTKLGSNDNMSGSVVLLEVARSLNKLINEGKLERPKRTLRFIWGDEFVGIIPWANEQKEIMDNALFDINLDMVGLGLAEQKSYYHLHRTTMANSHYSNDLVENIYRYIGITNQNSILNRSTTGAAFTDPVIAPTGSDDPFYYSLTDHYGASDHEVFNDWGIQVPAVMMITWPDQTYHTSADRCDMLDATQLKRAAVIAASVSYYAAIADEKEALEIGAEVAGNALRRIATQHNKVSTAMNRAEDVAAAYKNAVYQMEAVAIAENMGLQSIMELVPINTKVAKYIAAQQTQINNYTASAKASLAAAAEALGATTEFKLTDLEKKATKMYPKTTPKVREMGYGVLNNVYAEKYGKEARMKLATMAIGDSAEAARLTLHGDKSILDIYKMVDAQSTKPTDLQTLIDFMGELESYGLVTITTKR